MVHARDKQIPPEGDWFVWLIRSGRGFGKTRTGAEWVIERARQGYTRIALVGQTKADVRDTMVELGDSSILKVCEAHYPDFVPDYESSKRRLTFPNGAVAIIYSGDEPDQLRGPQHDSAWVDELAKFKYPDSTWDNLELGLRLGDRPQVVVTTTPRPIPIIRRLMDDDGCVDTVGSSYENFANLSPRFIERITKRFEGTRIGRQELHGDILDDNPAALWTRDIIDHVTEAPELMRIVVGVDPPGGAAECGIVVAGKDRDDNLYVLDDKSLQASPSVWATEVITAYNKWDADRVVGEANYGGDMVENTIRTTDGGKRVAYKNVRATRGKTIRAEPIAGIYEQARAHHVGMFAELEDEMCQWDQEMNDSPNRMDALVWAATELMLENIQTFQVAYA